MTQFCGECIHNYVCKYAEEFIEKKASQVIKEGSETDNIFTTTITCKYYKKSELTVKKINIKEVDPLYTTAIKNFGTTRNCESCSWYNSQIEDGGVYAGDCPCDWCDKSPIKVTC